MILKKIIILCIKYTFKQLIQKITLFGLVMGDSIYAIIQDVQSNGVLPNFLA